MNTIAMYERFPFLQDYYPTDGIRYSAVLWMDARLLDTAVCGSWLDAREYGENGREVLFLDPAGNLLGRVGQAKGSSRLLGFLWKRTSIVRFRESVFACIRRLKLDPAFIVRYQGGRAYSELYLYQPPQGLTTCQWITELSKNWQ